MAEVYLAQHTGLDRKVALKLLPAQFTQDESGLRCYRGRTTLQAAARAEALGSGRRQSYPTNRVPCDYDERLAG